MTEGDEEPRGSEPVDASLGEEGRAGSVLLLALPELEGIVGGYRQRYTADGPVVPPHITLLYPFFAPDEITPGLLRRVANVIASVPAFAFSLARLASFPQGVLYLAPEPAPPLVGLITQLRRTFPEITPYWDEYDEVTPHLTVADLALTDRADLTQEIEVALVRRLPIQCQAREAVLLQRLRPKPAPWDERGRFPLAAWSSSSCSWSCSSRASVRCEKVF
jgi:2'-5' RNA ligase